MCRNLCICPARGDILKILAAQHIGKGTLHHSLQGQGVRLFLPTVKPKTQVLNLEQVIEAFFKHTYKINPFSHN